MIRLPAPRLEPAHPADRGGLTIETPTIHHSTHRRIGGKTIGVGFTLQVLHPRVAKLSATR